MKIPTAGPDADTAVIRRQIQTATDAVRKALADLDGAVGSLDDTAYRALSPYPAHLLPDLVGDLSDACVRLESAARHAEEIERQSGR